MAEDKDIAQEEVDNRRFFFGPDEETKYYIQPPTAEDIRGADWQYSKTYTQCLVEGITTQAEMMDILTRRGIIGPEFEQRANELGQNLSAKIELLDSEEDMDKKRLLAIEVAQAREELFQWNQRLNGPMNNTAEQMSDDARLEYLTSCMVVDTAEKKVWDSYDTYLREKSQALAMRARFEVMLYLQGLESDFLDQTPEAQAMKEIEQDVLEKARAAIEAAEAVAEEEAAEAAAEAAEVKSKPKTTRRRTTRKPKKDEE
jgi:hypothetical protein